MYKFIRRFAAVCLAAALMAGQSMTALATPEQDAMGYGPGFAGSETVSQTAPGEAGGGQSSGQEQEASSDGQTAAEGQAAEDGQGQAAADGQGQAAADGQTQEGEISVAEENDALKAAEEAAAQEEAARQAALNSSTPYLQVQVLTPDMNWTAPVVDDSYIQTGGAGFRSMCIYLNNIVGNVLYRTYSAPNGWTQWAMNGEHTDLFADGSLVEAFQLRFTGYAGNLFDVYYCSNLSDGTQLDWARNGDSSGAMAVGKYIDSFRVSLWGKGTEGAVYVLDHPLDSAEPEGIRVDENGAVVFASGTGAPYTGWAWENRDRYYVVNNVPVTGWQYIDGYKYYFDETGKLVTDLEPLIGANGPFLIRINKQMNTTTVYVQDGANGFIIPLKSFLCSTGEDTPLGTFKTPEKYRWRLMNSGVYCQYATRLGSGLDILMHSLIYTKPDVNTLHPETYNFLGVVRSAGCIRFLASDCKWIYDHCPVGTTVEVYNSPIPGPYDRPAIEWVISDAQTWDPTDPVAAAQH